ncbi:MAG: sensor histidine kinase [bacterium]|nr:sensor histidine kinase [bacterium]
MDAIPDPTQIGTLAQRRRQIAADIGVLIVAALFDAGVASASTGSGIDALGFIIWGVSLGSLMWRRRQPIVVLATTAVGAMAFMAIGYRAVNIFPFIFATYSTALYCTKKVRARVAVLASSAAVLCIFWLATLDRGEFETGDLIRNSLLLGASFAVGNMIRTRNVLAQAHIERAQQRIEEERRLSRDAIAAERLQIARELHDIVAHSVTVMTVQLGGARLNIWDNPKGAGEALDEAESAGRRAMRELRRMLGVLRAVEETPMTQPLPARAPMEALIDQMRVAGFDASLQIVGTPKPVPEALEATMFRIAQEALTNAAKHGGPSATAEVLVTWGNDTVRIDVTNDSRIPTQAAPPGFGLMGMRERVALFGGTLAHRPEPQGGFRVEAVLPLESEDENT